MNTTRIAIAWLSDTEPIAVPINSAVVRLSDDLVLVLVPSGRLYAVFVNSSTTMRVPDRTATDLRAQYFERGVAQVLHEHP